MHVFYLHGFASSPRSSKATYLARKLAAHGVTLHAPDFNEPDFSTLTITRMIGQVIAALDALPSAPVALVGSSLGAFVAVQVALARPAQIDRLILLAPALDFAPAEERGHNPSGQAGGRGRTIGGKSIDEWQRRNSLDIFHYGYGRMATIRYDLFADACGYDCINATLSMPIQIFQGTRDDAVDPQTVQRWAQSRPNVELHMLDDDHQLTASIEFVWREMRRFLSLTD